MDFENIAQALIYIHAGFGGLALIAGTVSLFAAKGMAVHKKSGKVFFYGMLLSSISALVISVLPNHESTFLFAIGIFSTYFILMGYRALKYKNQNPDLRIDRMISWAMILTGALMILYPLVIDHAINIVLTIFGSISLIFSIRDLVLFKDLKKLKKSWLKLHLGKMTGAYISSVTAFIIVNNLIPGIYGWLIPSAVGSVFIFYWIRKVGK